MSPLHLDYRPQNFNEFYGNKSAIQSIQSILDREDKPHAWMFVGPKGCGKTTLARILSKELGCDQTGFLELDAASMGNIENIRFLRRSAQYAPLFGNIKVYLIDECHRLTGAAAEAMLKFLEDTPKHIYVILCTTLPEKVIGTIKNRCTTYSVQPLVRPDMSALLKGVLECEKIKLDSEVFNKIVACAEGCPRTALVILDQIIDLPNEDQLDAIEIASVEDAEIIELCRQLIKQESWKTVRETLKKLKNPDPESVRRAVLGYMTQVMLKADRSEQVSGIITEFLSPFYDSGKAGLIQACYMVTLIR